MAIDQSIYIIFEDEDNCSSSSFGCHPCQMQGTYIVQGWNQFHRVLTLVFQPATWSVMSLFQGCCVRHLYIGNDQERMTYLHWLLLQCGCANGPIYARYHHTYTYNRRRTEVPAFCLRYQGNQGIREPSAQDWIFGASLTVSWPFSNHYHLII